MEWQLSLIGRKNLFVSLPLSLGERTEHVTDSAYAEQKDVMRVYVNQFKELEQLCEILLLSN